MKKGLAIRDIGQDGWKVEYMLICPECNGIDFHFENGFQMQVCSKCGYSISDYQLLK